MKPILVENFGKDHWSLMAYFETCCVDDRGKIDGRRMRCNIKRHPMLYVTVFPGGTDHKWDPKYGTIAKDKVHSQHDDWDCFDDLVAAGFVKLATTLVNPVVAMTDRGVIIAAQLRRHKASGRNFHSFVLEVALT